MVPHQKLSRVAITGMGAICGLGHNLPTIWSAMIQGKSGVNKIQKVNTDLLPINFGGEVQDFQIAEDLIAAKEQKKYDLFVHYALQAIHEALLDASLPLHQASGAEHPLFYPANRVGCILGVGMGGFPLIEESHSTFLEKGAKRVTPFFIPSVIPNMATGLASIRFDMKGVNYSISSACASSGHALIAAATEIMLGRHDIIVSGGAEGVLSYLPISGFASMKALSKRMEEPQKASRPFDQDRDGFVIGEGAGILVLENYEKALARGARIYGELVGFGANADAHHITAPHPEGDGAVECVKQALESAGVSAEQIDYINAHGTSTPLGDIAETKALKKAFGKHAYQLKVSSTKSMTGHLLGAAGGIESIFCLKALSEGIIPPTINLDAADPECDLDYVPHHAVKKPIEYALNNSFGFGGTNSSLIFKKV